MRRWLENIGHSGRVQFLVGGLCVWIALLVLGLAVASPFLVGVSTVGVLLGVYALWAVS